jgi:iron(III) transport system ATP-binding protein
MVSVPVLKLDRVTKKFDQAGRKALSEVSFDLEQGELIGILGPSGCGKTTLLRIIAGFEKSSQGTVQLRGDLVDGQHHWLPPEQRNTGMVFQDYALFPHLTIAKNIAFGLKGRGHQQIKVRVKEILDLIGLGELGNRYPHQLSGGQQQRVALGRALAPAPDLILLDEPLSNLDVQVRQRLRHEIRRILKQSGTSALFVTHDQEEALAISDRIAVMRDGKLEQIGTPEEIYITPQSRFVAEFVTQANFLPAKLGKNCWETEIGDFEINHNENQSYQWGDLMVREEELVIKPDDGASIVVKDRQFLGREYRYCLQTSSGNSLHARSKAFKPLDIGTKVTLSLNNDKPCIFPQL